MFLLVEFLNQKILRTLIYVRPFHFGLFIWVKYFVIKT